MQRVSLSMQNGITSKLDYIKSLGVNALWLNPIFESGWFDGGY